MCERFYVLKYSARPIYHYIYYIGDSNVIISDNNNDIQIDDYSWFIQV